MSITPGNLSMLLAIASSIAPSTWALVAGVTGVAVGFFGKQFYDHFCRADDTSNASIDGVRLPSDKIMPRSGIYDPTGRLPTVSGPTFLVRV